MCGKVRDFCSGCATLDSELPLRPSVHAFVASKANWVEINDGLPQHPEYFA